MKPFVFIKSEENDVFMESLIACITCVDCDRHFSDHLAKDQSEQRAIVRDFQNLLRDILKANFPTIDWSLEHVHNANSGDAVDLFGRGDTVQVVIEVDKPRADQVSKKFVSRSAIFANAKMYYISLCYPGTGSMSVRECIKYFRYCAEISKRIGNAYAGLIMQTTYGH
jgi:hypothetical protein